MLLSEMSLEYKKSQISFHTRITELRAAARAEADAMKAAALQGRIKELEPLWKEARDLTELTARYYERGYHKNEKYTL